MEVSSMSGAKYYTQVCMSRRRQRRSVQLPIQIVTMEVTEVAVRPNDAMKSSI